MCLKLGVDDRPFFVELGLLRERQNYLGREGVSVYMSIVMVIGSGRRCFYVNNPLSLQSALKRLILMMNIYLGVGEILYQSGGVSLPKED